MGVCAGPPRPRVGAAGSARRCLPSAARQSLVEVGEAGRAQAADQAPVLGRAVADEAVVQRREIGGRRRDEARRGLGEAEQMHVQVAGRCGQLPEPPELGCEPRREITGQRVAGEFQRGPGPAYGDPQIVQELGVDVADDAVDVGFADVEQPQQHRRDGRARGHRRRQRDVHLAAVVAGSPPGGGERRVEGRTVGRGHAGRSASSRSTRPACAS